MRRDDGVYFNHIIDAITTIEGYLAGIDEPTFRSQQLLQDGVIRQLAIIGEAVKHLSKTVRSQHAHIPWQDIAGMRDMLVHQYFGIDLDEVWLTARDDLPALKIDIQRIRASLQPH